MWRFIFGFFLLIVYYISTADEAAVIPRHWNFDDSLVASVKKFDPSQVVTIEKDDKDDHPGTWGRKEYCPYGSIVTGFDVQYIPDQGSQRSADSVIASVVTLGIGLVVQEVGNWRDDYGVTAIALKCTDIESKRATQWLHSDFLDELTLHANGYTGAKWVFGGPQRRRNEYAGGDEFEEEKIGELAKQYNNGNCPKGYPAIGFMVKVQPPQGHSDDVAVTNFKLICPGMRESLEDPPIHFPSIHPDQWSEQILCPNGHAVCGMATKVHWAGSDVDNEGLTNIRLKCCRAVKSENE